MQLIGIIISAILRQHVQESTRRHGHILYLVISRYYQNFIKCVSVSSTLSDHFLIIIGVSLQRQSVAAKVISYKNSFLGDLRVSSLVLDPPDDSDHLLDFYNSTPRDPLVEHAPLRTKDMSRIPLLPWYNKEIQAAKRRRGYCERLYFRTGVCVH